MPDGKGPTLGHADRIENARAGPARPQAVGGATQDARVPGIGLHAVDREDAAEALRRSWERDGRWRGVRRDYDALDVVRLRGSINPAASLAFHGATRLWNQLHTADYTSALGALTGGQAVQMVRAGMEAIYVSGWQVAADNNLAAETYPDMSLYPVTSVPALVDRINRALRRADQIEWAEGNVTRDWMVPIVADAEAGFGGPLNSYELMRAMIVAGAAGVHFEDQLASAKKCGHMGGKVLIPAQQHVRNLRAARLASDVLDVPTVLIARTDAHSAKLLSSDADPRDRPFTHSERTREGHTPWTGSIDAAIHRGLVYAPYADLLWFETSKPDLEEATRFAQAIHTLHPGKLLAYNLSPSFHWKTHLSPDDIASFQGELGRLGFRFQFVTLAGFHALNAATFELAHAFAREGMPAYVRLQEQEFALAGKGYTATHHQHEVGAGYFDTLAGIIAPGDGAFQSLDGSTEGAQFAQPLARLNAAKRDEANGHGLA